MSDPTPGAIEQQVSPSELDLGQEVRILGGENRGISGNIIACEQTGMEDCWHYFVKAGRVEYGPYTAKELW